jgi:ABC-type sugar transport system substrate-binding protein
MEYTGEPKRSPGNVFSSNSSLADERGPGGMEKAEEPESTGKVTSAVGKVSRRKILGMGAAAAGVGLVAACGSTAGKAAVGKLAGNSKGLLIYVPAQGASYNLYMEVGFYDALTPLGWDFQMIAPPEGGAPSAAVTYIEEAISRKPDALAIAYPGSGAGVSQIADAINTLKFVICCNQEDQPYTSQQGLAFVGQDTVTAGGTVGTNLCSLLKKAGKTGGTIIAGNEAPGGSSVLYRFEGATAAVKAFNAQNGTSFTLINMPDFALEPAKGIETYKAKVLELGKDFAGILTLGGDSTALMPSVGKALGWKPGQYVIGGFDTSPLVTTAIEDGWVAFTIDQQFYSQGSIAGWLAWQAVERGQVPPPLSDTGERIVTKANIKADAALVNQQVALAKKYGFSLAAATG